MPESFKVLVKELQALCLDVRVLDQNGEVIELQDDDDDYPTNFNAVENRSDEREFVSRGYSVEEAEVPEEEENSAQPDINMILSALTEDVGDMSDMDFDDEDEEDVEGGDFE